MKHGGIPDHPPEPGVGELLERQSASDAAVMNSSTKKLDRNLRDQRVSANSRVIRGIGEKQPLRGRWRPSLHSSTSRQ